MAVKGSLLVLGGCGGFWWWFRRVLGRCEWFYAGSSEFLVAVDDFGGGS